LKRGLQRDNDFEKRWPAVLATRNVVTVWQYAGSPSWQLTLLIGANCRDRCMKRKESKNEIVNQPSIVFCHGFWADGSCFSKVIPALQAEGHQVIAAQYALSTTADDIATVRGTLGRVNRPAILVGHSYGGSVITGAGTDNRVAGLVYIAALAPDADETSLTQQSNFPKTDVFSCIEVAEGRIWLLPEGIEYFAGELSEQEKKLFWATQYVPAPDLFNAKVGGTAWRSKPSWYIVAKNDRTVHPDRERLVAKRMGAKVTEVASRHVPMLSHPEVVINVIRAAANAVQATTAEA
jgi:pimeloyl-ACP methyl ester carboxylesterase